MARETAEVLEEIAALLRQYVEHTGEMSKRAQERLAQLPRPANVTRDIKDIERRSEAAASRRAADERAFRKRLLDLLETHNAMLERLLRAQATRGKATPKRKARRS